MRGRAAGRRTLEREEGAGGMSATATKRTTSLGELGDKNDTKPPAMDTEYNLDSASQFVECCGRSWGAGIPLAKQFADVLFSIMESGYWRKFKIQVKTYENATFTERVTSHPPKGLNATIKEVDEALVNAGHKEALMRFRAEVAGLQGDKDSPLHVKPGNPTGANQHGGGNHNKIMDSSKVKQGTSATYLLRRIARTHPEVLTRYEKGEFKSVRAAAIEAGIVVVRPPLQVALAAYKRLSAQERAAFAAAVEGGEA